MKKLIFGAIALLILQLSLSVPASASTLYCAGNVVSVYVDNTGKVYIKGDWRNDWTRICDLKGELGVDPVTCSMWTSIIDKTMTDSMSIMVTYDNGSGTLACDTLPTYNNSPNPNYVMVR